MKAIYHYIYKYILYLCITNPHDTFMIKAVFFDIDGTLVSFNTHEIPLSTREAIKKLKENNIKVFIATGRPQILINNVIELEFDSYIIMNGAHCFTKDKKDIHKELINTDDIKRVIEYIKEKEYPFVFVNDNGWFITKIDLSVEEICKLIEIPAPPIRPAEYAIDNGVMQMMGYFPQEADQKIFGKILTHCDTMRWHPLFTDIVNKGTSKSNGIDKVIEYYGIKLEETMAFGDGGNDIPMLKHVHIGVAMGNASDEVKAHADYITDTVDNDGIMKALKHFKIIE